MIIDLIVEALAWFILLPYKIWLSRGERSEEIYAVVFMQIGWFLVLISQIMKLVAYILLNEWYW